MKSDRDRSGARRRATACIASRGPGAGLRERGGGDARHQGRDASRRATCSCWPACGPLGTGMEETYQVTGALKHLAVRQARRPADRRAVLRRLDGRLHRPRRPGRPGGRPDRQGARRRPDSHPASTAVASRGPSILSATAERRFTADDGARVLAQRKPRPDLAPNAALPEDTRLWAALQLAGGGTWAGCVYDAERIGTLLKAGQRGAFGRAGMSRATVCFRSAGARRKIGVAVRGSRPSFRVGQVPCMARRVNPARTGR